MRAAAATNRRFLSLGFFLLLCFTAAAAGGLATYPNTENWYASLSKPDWTPPHAIFAPIWTILYALMAVSAWLVWDRRRGEAFPALKLFAYQLGLNVLWSILFFGLRNPDAAAAEMIVWWMLVGATAVAFHRVRRLAGLLLAPYWACVSFALALNFSVVGRN